MAKQDDRPGTAEDKPKSRMARFAISIARLICFGYATVLVALIAMEGRLVYPGAYMNVPPIEAEEVKSVEYRSADGTSLTGQLYESAGSQRTLLYLHGNGTIAKRASHFITRIGQQLGANVLAAEFRGYDDLDGKPTEADVIHDCFAARDFLVDRYQIAPSELILYGQSLGGGCAVAVAADSGARLLVLERTFDCLVDVAAARYPIFPVKLLMRNRFDSTQRIKDYHGPLVQLHGTTDRLIPIDHARRLHAVANCQPKYWINVPEMGHNDPIPSEAWAKCLDAIQIALETTESDCEHPGRF